MSFYFEIHVSAKVSLQYKSSTMAKLSKNSCLLNILKTFRSIYQPSTKPLGDNAVSYVYPRGYPA